VCGSLCYKRTIAEQHQHKHSSSKYVVTQTTVLSYAYIFGYNVWLLQVRCLGDRMQLSLVRCRLTLNHTSRPWHVFSRAMSLHQGVCFAAHVRISAHAAAALVALHCTASFFRMCRFTLFHKAKVVWCIIINFQLKWLLPERAVPLSFRAIKDFTISHCQTVRSVGKSGVGF
jgi:hypothetical protein